jgi:short-chain fatty acids transporter
MTDFQAQPRSVRARASPPSVGPRISAQLAKLGIPLQQQAELIPALSTTASASAPACEKIAAEGKSAALETMALAITAWSERWFPDTFVFATLALALACAGAMLIGATPQAVAVAFGDGFWNLMPFTMQMVLIVVTGHVVARALPTARLIERLARLPRTGRGAVAYVAIVSMTTSLLNWAVSLVFAGLLARELARRDELKMDYRAAGAAAYLGLGATWAMGVSSSAAQLEANPQSIPKQLLAISGVIPFSETIFLWQSVLIAAVVIAVSVAIAYVSAPAPGRAVTTRQLGITLEAVRDQLPPRRRPGEWLEYSPIPTLFLSALGLGWLVNEFATKNATTVISGLNTFNLAFLLLGLLLHWRPRRFLIAVSQAVTASSGILIQFPLYASLAHILINAKGTSGHSLGDCLSTAFVSAASAESFPVLVGIYSGVLGIFIPSGGGRWIVEAPFVMQAAMDLRVNLGWAVQAYNAAGALPNLINPFWMVPLLGIVGFKARDLIGFTFVHFVFLGPLVLFLLWLLAGTLPFHPPMMG